MAKKAARMVACKRNGGGAQLRETRSLAKRRKFLTVLAETANVRLSSRRSGLSATRAYGLRKEDPAFAQGWDEALCAGYERLELLLLERAIAGLAPEEAEGVAEAASGADATQAAPARRNAGTISERGMLALLAQHRGKVQALRIAAAQAANRDLIAEETAARAALEAKLQEIRERLDRADG